ncbi:hypothetical protein PENNAL_c0134G03825 [Penicillium nalgiovense]|uniref:Uncharacterized protein n=1 Tax=Penicillium nalgiovense TaxID=60175 RepID=A0A1V6X2P6_PENNA|nr:hypothetical protein PENNAL_c0134G03825 [Penicillium nalgiovense]
MSNMPTEPIDFFGHRVSSPLPRIETVRHDLQPILKLMRLYIEIIDRNGSVAKQLHKPLFSNKIEDRINGLFSSSRPRVVELASDDSLFGGHPSWVNLIQEANLNNQIELRDEDQYRLCVRGLSLDMNKSDRDILSSNVLQKLLLMPPEPEDVQAEREARTELIKDLTRLREDILEIDETVQTILQTLQEQTHSADRDFTRSESSESPVEIHMCDVEANTDSAVHTETRIDAEPSPDHCRDGETGSTLVALSTSGEESHIPPLKMTSAWSPLEKRQLRAFLSTRGHLSWSRIAQEYEEIFHRGRSPSSISGQARCLGLSVGRKPRKKPAQQAQPAKRDPLVLKVRFPSDNKPSPTEQTKSAERVQQPTGNSLGEEDPGKISEHTPQLPDMASSPMNVHVASPSVGPNVPSMMQFITTKDYANVRQSNHVSPGSFGLILN